MSVLWPVSRVPVRTMVFTARVMRASSVSSSHASAAIRLCGTVTFAPTPLSRKRSISRGKWAGLTSVST